MHVPGNTAWLETAAAPAESATVPMFTPALAARGSDMPFEFDVQSVEYQTRGEDADTVLTGRLTAGGIRGPEWVVLPTKGGQSYRFWMIAMEVEGDMQMPLRPGTYQRIELVLSGQPPDRDVVVPCVAVADGVG